jgi:hypothetical protein
MALCLVSPACENRPPQPFARRQTHRRPSQIRPPEEVR